ncbi:MAG: hypothetical protein KDD78_10525, partial [Caldilineaceae bacterium]|nr:hypothetical protein [Caldilineaceae bacterium]
MTIPPAAGQTTPELIYQLISDPLQSDDGHWTALYTPAPGFDQPAAHYFLLFLGDEGAGAPVAPPQIELAASWQMLGCAVFTPHALPRSDFAALAKTLAQALPLAVGTDFPRFAWLGEKSEPIRQLRVKWGADLTTQQIVNPPALAIGRFTLQLRDQTPMQFSGDAVDLGPEVILSCTGPANHAHAAATRLIQIAAVNPRLLLTGPQAGSIQAQATID